MGSLFALGAEAVDVGAELGSGLAETADAAADGEEIIIDEDYIAPGSEIPSHHATVSNQLLNSTKPAP